MLTSGHLSWTLFESGILIVKRLFVLHSTATDNKSKTMRVDNADMISRKACSHPILLNRPEDNTLVIKLALLFQLTAWAHQRVFVRWQRVIARDSKRYSENPAECAIRYKIMVRALRARRNVLSQTSRATLAAATIKETRTKRVRLAKMKKFFKYPRVAAMRYEKVSQANITFCGNHHNGEQWLIIG